MFFLSFLSLDLLFIDISWVMRQYFFTNTGRVNMSVDFGGGNAFMS